MKVSFIGHKMVFMFSHVQLFATPWTVARQAPLSMGFFRQVYWNGLLFLRQGMFPRPGVLHSLGAQMVKCLSTMWETWARSLGWKDSLEKEMATHSSILAWEIPWTEDLELHEVAKSCKTPEDSNMHSDFKISRYEPTE